MDFPFGRAPLAILILALIAGLWIGVATLAQETRAEPDLYFATFAKDHAVAYAGAIGAFEEKHGVKVEIQVVDGRALQSRLAAAMQSGAPTPDVVEIVGGSLGTFTKGPLEDVGFVDLTELVKRENLMERVVASRFPQWMSRGRVFALPHDVHPTMLAYNQELLHSLGVDESELATWDDFARVARERIVKDVDGDGVIDHYMIDLPISGADILRSMLLQRGGRLFNEDGSVAFDSPEAVDVLEWYIKASYGPDKIAFPAGWGQNLAKSAIDGLVLFYTTPDWRSKQFMNDMASLSGKMRLMPLPAWEPGARRTSTWGGTGLAITKQAQENGKLDLAWELAMFLYYKPDDLADRFAETNILPPLKAAWELPQFDEPYPYYGGQAIGREYANLGDDVPSDNASPYEFQAMGKLLEAMTKSAGWYEDQRWDDSGLRERIALELEDAADDIRERIDRNQFLSGGDDDEKAGDA